MSNTRVTDKILEKPYFSRVGIMQALISVIEKRIQNGISNLRNPVFLGFFFTRETLWDVLKSGEIYSVCNAFATRLQQKYLKNLGHFSVIDTGECPLLCRFCVSIYAFSIF